VTVSNDSGMLVVLPSAEESGPAGTPGAASSGIGDPEQRLQDGQPHSAGGSASTSAGSDSGSGSSGGDISKRVAGLPRLDSQPRTPLFAVTRAPPTRVLPPALAPA
jgi:hypothetical protein